MNLWCDCQNEEQMLTHKMNLGWCVKLLLGARPNVNEVCHMGETALIQSCKTIN